MSESNAHAGGVVTPHDPRTDTLREVLENLMTPLATAIVETCDAVVRAHLASMGGDLLSTYGGAETNAAAAARDRIDTDVRAAIGGYLLERFGGAR